MGKKGKVNGFFLFWNKFFFDHKAKYSDRESSKKDAGKAWGTMSEEEKSRFGKFQVFLYRFCDV